MPISEEHPAVEAMSSALGETYGVSPRVALRLLSAALPHLKPEDVPGVRNALLDDFDPTRDWFREWAAGVQSDLASEQAPKVSHWEAALSHFALQIIEQDEKQDCKRRQQKEPRDD